MAEAEVPEAVGALIAPAFVRMAEAMRNR